MPLATSTTQCASIRASARRSRRGRRRAQRPPAFGDWNLGAGGAVRRSAGYEPFSMPGQTLRFQPGDEYRVRVGVDRAVRARRVALGLTYSAFGKDDVGGSVYNTGNRLIAQAMYADAFSGREVTFAAYNVFRGRGSYASGAPAGTENIADVFGSIALNSLGAPIEPSVELRHWLQHVLGATSGTTTIPPGPHADQHARHARTAHARRGRTSPDRAERRHTFGRLATVDGTGAPATGGLTGFRAQLAMRVAP